MDKRAVRAALAERLSSRGPKVAQAFLWGDEDRSGTVSRAEFRRVLAHLNLELRDADFDALVDAVVKAKPFYSADLEVVPKDQRTERSPTTPPATTTSTTAGRSRSPAAHRPARSPSPTTTSLAGQ